MPPTATLPADLQRRRAGYFVASLFPIAVLTRRIGKLRNKLVTKSATTEGAVRNQSAAVPGIVDKVFLVERSGEVAAIERGLSPPFRLSAFLIAEKVRAGSSRHLVDRPPRGYSRIAMTRSLLLRGRDEAR